MNSSIQKQKINKKTSPNSGLAQLGFQANFKVGFVLGSWFLIRYIWLTKSPTDAKPRDVVCYFKKTEQKLKNKIMKIDKLNKAKIPVVKINKKLEEFRGKILFPKKLALANEMLLKVKLPTLEISK